MAIAKSHVIIILVSVCQAYGYADTLSNVRWQWEPSNPPPPKPTHCQTTADRQNQISYQFVEQIKRELGKQENKKHELESKLQSLDEKAVAIHEKAISQAEDTIHTQTTRRRRKT